MRCPTPCACVPPGPGLPVPQPRLSCSRFGAMGNGVPVQGAPVQRSRFSDRAPAGRVTPSCTALIVASRSGNLKAPSSKCFQFLVVLVKAGLNK